MYVTSSRVRSPHGVKFSSGYSGHYYNFIEETYSWRTGRNARRGVYGQHVVQPPPPALASAGVGLGDRIRARNKYLTQVSDNVAKQNSGREPQSRFLSHDTGHSFMNVKHIRRGGGRITTTYARYPGRVDVDYGAVFMQGAVGPVQVAPHTVNFSNTWGVNSVCGPDSATLRIDAASLFESARPDSSVAGWGETIAELVSGNVPKIITRLGRDIASGKFIYKNLKENSKNVGSDYLNGMFGWAPIMRDFKASLEHLLGIHDFLYSASYRRHRAIPARDSWKKTTYHPALGNPGTAVGTQSAVITGPKVLQGDAGMYTYRYDTRLAARFTKARPSAKANAFADRALDILQNWGVLYPSLSWDLIPYSWLLDWSMHIGKGIENYSTYSSNGGSYKTDYAYSTTRSIATVSFPGSYAVKDYPGSYTRKAYYQELFESTICTFREPATPFGFGVSLAGLSSSQYAILVALGLARQR